MESRGEKKKKREGVGLVVSGAWGLIFLPRTESEQRHSEATVKTSPRQREEHARGNLKKRMTVREAMMADGRKTLLKVLEVISDHPEPSRLWPNQKALLIIGENTIYGIRKAGRLDGRKRFSST